MENRYYSVADPGCLSRIPDPTFFHPGSRIRIVSIPDPGSASKNLSILTPKKPKKWFRSSRKYDPDCSSRIPDPDADFLPIPDPGSKGQKGTGSRIPDPDPQHYYCTDQKVLKHQELHSSIWAVIFQFKLTHTKHIFNPPHHNMSLSPPHQVTQILLLVLNDAARMFHVVEVNHTVSY